MGATQYVQWVNTSFAVFDKSTGNVIYGPALGKTLWTGFGGACEADNDGDPIAQYDKAANRWVMSQFSVTTGPGFFQCFAISKTPDATGAYYRYSFAYANFPDYPKVSVWPDAYYASFNMFDSTGTTFLGGNACAFDRAGMLAGTARPAQCFQQNGGVPSLLPSDLDGTRPPPPGSPAYFVNSPNAATASSLSLWKFHVDWARPGNSTFTGPTTISVPTFTQACAATGTCIPQAGTSTQLDALGDRLMYRLAYRNFGDHESLVVNHSIAVNGVTGIRWYELRQPATTPTVFQSGTYAPNDGKWRWMGSIGMDAAGDLGLGFSESGSTIHPAIMYTGRVPSDPAGALETESILFAGAGSQTVDSGGHPLTRWGDYSGMSIDPVDDCTFWYTNQYLRANGGFNWSTRIGSFKFAGCVSPPTGLSASPISSSQIGLSWTASSGATSYKIQRSPDGSTAWTQVGTSTTAAFTDTGLNPSTTYYYRVLASNTGGDSAPSNVASATTAPALAYSQAPQGNWVSSYGADGYTLAAWNGGSDLAFIPLSSLVLDNGYRYQWSSSTTAVQALQSPDKLSRQAGTFAADGAPLRLHLTFPATYAGNLHLYALDWESAGRRETITVDDGSGPRTANISTDFSQGAWVNAPINVAAGGSVTITVTVTAGTNAVLSGIFLGGPLPPAPPAPTNLAATTVSSSQIGLSWTASSGATSYKIQRSPDGSTGWTQVGTSPTTAFTDTGLNPATTYYYRVLASTAAGDSTPSNMTSATTAAGLAYSQAPQGNWASSYGADGYALAAWNGGYDLAFMPLSSSLTLDNGYRYLWSSSTTVVQALQSPDTLTRRAGTFAADGAPLRLHLSFPAAYAGTLHLYALDWESAGRRETITVNDGSGSGPRTATISTDFSQGAWVTAPMSVAAGGSVTITVTVTAGTNAVLSGIFLGGPLPPAPAAPTSLSASPVSSSQIGLNWTASSGATGYKIQRSLDGSSGWTQVGTSTTTAFTDTGLSPATTYFYRVLASASGVDSAPSNVASAATAAGLAYSQAPQGNWVNSYGADGYALAAWNGGSDLAFMPLSSSLTLDNGYRYLWSSSTTVVQALQSPDQLSRRAGTFAADGAPLRLHLTFPATYNGNLRLYALDWEDAGRRETITVDDGSGPRTANISTDFSQGAWVNAPINVAAGGSVTITVIVTAGTNAVLSGIFLR